MNPLELVLSRKRKQPSPSNPFTGTYTRSKSRIYLHHNRSGQARSDTIRKRNHMELSNTPRSKPRSSDPREDSGIDTISQFSIKDLRARRVFSPSSILDEDEYCLKPSERSDSGQGTGKYEMGMGLNDDNPNLCLVTESCCLIKDDSLKSDQGISFTDQDLDDSNPNLSSNTEGFCSMKDESLKTDQGISVIGQDVDDSTPNSELVMDLCSSGEDNAVGSVSSCEKKSDKNGEIGNFIEECAKMEPAQVDENGGKDAMGMTSNLSVRRNGSVSRSKSVANSCGRQRVFKSPSSFNYNRLLPFLTDIKKDDYSNSKDNEPLNRVVGLVEECLQMTPPDADIFSKPGADDSGISKEENVSQTEDQVLEKPPNGTISRNDSCLGKSLHQNFYQKHDTNSKSKLVLNPCSRLKVNRTPSSVSYRRLLPFLMDIAKENSCVSTISKNPRLEKTLKVKQEPQLLPSPRQEVHVEKCEMDGSPEYHHTGDKEPSSPAAEMTPTDDANPVLPTVKITPTDANPVLPIENGSSNSKEPNLVSTENITEPHMPFGSEMEETLQLEQVMPDSPRKLEAEPLCDFISLSHEEVNLATECELKVPQNDSVDTGRDCIVQGMDLSKDDGESVKKVSSFPTDAFHPLGTCITKGILKRRPRGCRGLCNCLNCASFRLHAERAFEFSRNQMQDAEEVALELIKELENFRNMLGKSDFDDYKFVLVPASKVKQACRRVMKTEELVKKRLREMNDDLNIHCRVTCLQRPRVTFVEGKCIIPEADLASKNNKEDGGE